MKTRGSTPEESAALTSFVDALQLELEVPGELRSAWATLQRYGVSLVLRVELAAGGDPPRIVIGEKRPAMPQWSERDVDVLHSLGISSEPSNDAGQFPSQPRRRQPR
ncbi:MAG: hypothetical protein ACHQQS_11025 [Thermoanaerobaculales bacterium]